MPQMKSDYGRHFILSNPDTAQVRKIENLYTTRMTSYIRNLTSEIILLLQIKAIKFRSIVEIIANKLDGDTD